MRTNSSFFLFFFEKALTLLTIKIIIENKFIEKPTISIVSKLNIEFVEVQKHAKNVPQEEH